MFKAAPMTAAARQTAHAAHMPTRSARHSTAVPSSAGDAATAVPAARATAVKSSSAAAVKSSTAATIGEGGSGSQRNAKNRSNVKAIEFWVHESSLGFRVGDIATR
ncbi:MAG TPA: hypothetical protein PK867_05915 [Pirellulales bacterium]|nr:hypothetical protein [Pirellulales bacterium]